MKVLALVPSQKGYSPGQRGSIELWEDVLEPEGIHPIWSLLPPEMPLEGPAEGAN